MDCVQKLNLLDPDKLMELTLMHLSFTLDLNDIKLSDLMGFKNPKKKPRNYFSRLVKEKVPGEVYSTQQTISHIYEIIEYLGRDINVRKEGLFCKTGILTRQNELKSLLKNEENFNLDSGLYCVHDYCNLLIHSLAEMPEPLLSDALYSALCQIADMSINSKSMSPSQINAVIEKQLKSTKLLLLLLPPDNYCLLKYLLLLLYQIHNSTVQQKVSSENLAILFAPHIIYPRKIPTEQFKISYPKIVRYFTFLIENAVALSEPPKELVQDIMMCLKEMSFEGQIQGVNKEDEAVKTMITFCDRTKVPEAQSSDYTIQELLKLQTYIKSLPDTKRKRKLMKKFPKDNALENLGENISEVGQLEMPSKYGEIA